ncbi:unnamed protein product [Knipowitschia caucasica]
MSMCGVDKPPANSTREHLEDTKPQLSLPRLELKGPLDVGCQTDRVLTKHAFVQAQVKPLFRSKAIQARAPCRSVECSANFPAESSEISQGKRRRCEGSDGVSSSFCTFESDNNNRTSKEVPPQKSQFIVEEDKLMELFMWCPVCSNNCDVSKSMSKTLLLVKQRCTHCHFTNEWSSHSKPS